MAGRGGKLHEELIHRVIDDALPRMSERGYDPATDYFVLTDEFMIRISFSVSLGAKASKDPLFSQYPDILVIGHGSTVFVEVGKFVPDKWPSLPVIHIGFGKHVTLINATGASFETDLVQCIESSLTDPTCWQRPRRRKEVENQSKPINEDDVPF